MSKSDLSQYTNKNNRTKNSIGIDIKVVRYCQIFIHYSEYSLLDNAPN